MGWQMSLDVKHSVVWKRTTFPSASPNPPWNTVVFSHSSWRTYLMNYPEKRFSYLITIVVMIVFRLDVGYWEDWTRQDQHDRFTAIWDENLKHSHVIHLCQVNEYMPNSVSFSSDISLVYFLFKLVKLQQFGVINMLGQSFNTHTHSTFNWH